MKRADFLNATLVLVKEALVRQQAKHDSAMAELQAAVRAIPAGEKGADGEDGRDGIDGKDAVLDKDALVREVISLIPTPKDGVTGKRGEKGIDGRDGRDGKDGIASLDDLRAEVAKAKVELRDELPALAKTAIVEARAEDPWPVYREIWREGEYEKGAVVTWAGSAWIAREVTNEKPGEGATKWKLFVKQGRDGRDAR